MNDQHGRKLTVLTILVAILLATVIWQSIAILSMHKAITEGTSVALSSPTSAPDTSCIATSPPSLSTGLFGQDPFDQDLSDWDPFAEMRSMHDRINQMFGSAFNRFQQSDEFGSALKDYSFSPNINVEDMGDYYDVTVDLPGVENTQINVHVEGQTLSVSGTTSSERSDNNAGKMLRQERRIGRFRRTITLPSPVEADSMTTNQQKGVLNIKIQKAK